MAHTGSTSSFKWQWTGDGESDEWNDYDAVTSELLQTAVNDGETTARFTISYNRYVVRFSEMAQENVATGMARLVRQKVLLPPAELARLARETRRDAFLAVKKNSAAVQRLWKKCVKADDGDEMWYEADVDCPISRFCVATNVAADRAELYAFCWKGRQNYLGVLSRSEFDMALSELQSSASPSAAKKCTTGKAIGARLTSYFARGGELHAPSGAAFGELYAWAYAASVNALQSKSMLLSVAVQLWKVLFAGNFTPLGRVASSANSEQRFRYLKRWIDYCESEYALRGGMDDSRHSAHGAGASKVSSSAAAAASAATSTSKHEARITKDQWSMVLKFANDDVVDLESEYDEDKYALLIDDFVEWHLANPVEKEVKISKGKAKAMAKAAARAKAKAKRKRGSGGASGAAAASSSDSAKKKKRPKASSS